MIEYDKKLLDAVLRQDFSSFIGKVFHTINPGAEYQANWHIELIADYLEAVRAGNIKRLVINMPPRALKSVCVNVAWPAWLLAQQPSTRIMAASYSSVLSVKHSLDCRLVVNSEWYKKLFPNTILSRKHNQKSKFLTTENGFRFATSVGGSATGEGGDVLIIDDPHNPTQINSLKMRNRAIEWFEQTFVTRLNDKNKGAIVLVMQRLHADDLSAHLLSSGGWESLKIPAIAPENMLYDIGQKQYKYKKGELLNTKRDQIEFLNNIEQEVGARNYAAQFLQEPLPAGFNLLNMEDISFYEKTPDRFDYYVQSWDTAIKVSEKTDYSVGTCWGIVASKYYLVAMIRKKMSYPELKIEIEQFANKFKPRHLLIEDKASGQSVIQDLKLSGHPNIRAINPKLDKVTRFASIVTLFQVEKVLLPAKAHYSRELLRELTTFPNAKNDDIVDSVSQFLNFSKHMTCINSMRVRII
ncbi:MAG: phage terminase large subunit [Rickettsiaceae bacterium]|nr:phage terminase large subunit [Rickettsiaceae bacterium]MDP5020806.1 phage terminase large subunit [Rickettsiaceae bacterium]MDP5083599.1 phage terminase large subunit [Rickettsiaceae bacterium]